MSHHCRLCLAAGSFAAVVAAWPGASRAASADVVLSAMGGTTTQQGLPFEFRATVASAEPLAKPVVFLLTAPGGSSVAFASQVAVVLPAAPAELHAGVISSQWFAQVGRYGIQALIEGRPVGAPLTYQVTPQTAIRLPKFQDVTVSTGTGATLPAQTCNHWSNGAAWADVNGDRRLDLYVTRGTAAASQLFVQGATGKFTDEAAQRGVQASGFIAQGAVFADYDNDGDADLTVVGHGATHLFRNDGSGHFADVSTATKIDAGHFNGMSASWGDYDNDGKLDLYVANHSESDCVVDRFSLGTLTYHPDQLFHQNADGTFTDESALLGGFASTRGPGFQAAWFDANDDGRVDLYLGNDTVGQASDPNHLWRNDGPGANGAWTFTDVSVSSGTRIAVDSMGLGIGDYDRDLDLDLVISNWGINKLLRNNGNLTFTEATGTNMTREFQRDGRRSVTWGPEFADFNLDGWEDLYVAAGFIVGYLTEEDTPQPNELFVNDRKGAFLDLSAPSGADDAGQSRGVAVADYDRDGRLDIYVVNQGGTSHLLRNVTPTGKGKATSHWLELDLVGTRSNRDGCGARLVLRAATGAQLREVLCGGTSVSSGRSDIVHFGLGTASRITSLEVRWPSGLKQTYKKLKVDRLVKLTEPKV